MGCVSGEEQAGQIQELADLSSQSLLTCLAKAVGTRLRERSVSKKVGRGGGGGGGRSGGARL